MTLEEIQKLNNGDEVFWTDPDEGSTSRHITIQAIKVNMPEGGEVFGDEIISIQGKDGCELECYAHELS